MLRRRCVGLAALVVTAGVGCNTRARQCEKLVGEVTAVGAAVRAISGSGSAKALDQLIFAIARSRAELGRLDLPDLQLDTDRLRLTRLLDRSSTALRSFAEVSHNHDAADAEELRSRLEALAADERAVVADIGQHCRAP
jgi:hypothetical protein